MKYKLLRDWGIYKAGDVIETNSAGALSAQVPGMSLITPEYYPDWFQPVDEPERWKPEAKTTERDQEIFTFIRSKLFDPDDNKPIDGFKRELAHTVNSWLYHVEDEWRKNKD